MSLYEVLTMNLGLDKLADAHKPQVTDEEWEEAAKLLESVTANDPHVRI